MKKIIFTTSVILFTINLTLAQSFKLQNGQDTIRANVSGTKNLYNNVINISQTAVTVKWRVVTHDFPASWGEGFAICDNMSCYFNMNNSLLNGTQYTMMEIDTGKLGNFYILPDLTDAESGTHFITVNFSEGTTSINATWVVTKFNTGIFDIKEKIRTIVYPNPATNSIIFRYETNKTFPITIYNYLGSQVSSFIHRGNETVISLDGLDSGVYFIEVRDEQQSYRHFFIKQ